MVHCGDGVQQSDTGHTLPAERLVYSVATCPKHCRTHTFLPFGLQLSQVLLVSAANTGCCWLLAVAVAAGDKVAPGKSVTYSWLVPDRAGPGAGDLGSVMWMYHRYTNTPSSAQDASR